MATPATGQVVEPWIRYHAGVTWYSAGGTRDVFIIVSKEPANEEVIHRKTGELSLEDKGRLTREGISPECWSDEGCLMKEKYDKDKETMKTVYLKGSRYMINGEILNEFNNAKSDGVTIHYIGPGRINTGDWCFKDGFITFEDIAGMYMNHFKGRTLVIAADCSYSGKWVQDCIKFLQRNDVQPCGHSARAHKIQIKVFCSCQALEIGSTLLYSARGHVTDQTSGAKYVVTDKEIDSGQTTCFVDSTKIFCTAKPEEPCTLRPRFNYEEKGKRSRIIRKFQETKGNWRVIILKDNNDTIKTFDEVISGDHTKTVSAEFLRRYGLISIRTLTFEEAEDWILRMKNGIEDINFDSDFE